MASTTIRPSSSAVNRLSRSFSANTIGSLVHVPARGLEPYPPDPVHEHRAEQPQDHRLGVDAHDLLAVDVERDDQHREVAGGDAGAAQERPVGDRVAAPRRALPPGEGEVGELGDALGQRQAEEDEHGEGEQPEGPFGTDREGAGDHAQRVQGGEHDDVEHGLALERERVQQRQREVGGQSRLEQRRQERGEQHGGAREHADDRRPAPDRDPPARQRPAALGRVAPIGLQVEHVVDDVGRRGEQAHGEEGEQHRHRRPRIAQALIEQEGHRDQRVLGPLVHAHQVHVVAQAGPLVVDDMGEVDRLLVGDAAGGGHRDRLARGRPDLQIVLVVADVVEAALPEASDQPVALALRREVDVRARAVHLVEQSRAGGDDVGQGLMGARHQHDRTLTALALDQFDHLGAVGQLDLGEIDPRGDLGLQPRPAVEQPQRRAQRLQRPLAQQRQEALEQQVGADQRAVEVDAQRHRSVDGIFHRKSGGWKARVV